MKSSFCEDQNSRVNISGFHEEQLSKIGLPKWANVKCPFCSESLPLRSIRSIILKFNARNMGDVAVEVFCEKCSLMDTVYFRREFEAIEDAVSLLTGKKDPLNQPIIEETMYKLQYNNIVEKMLIGDNKCH